jgi:hypothetical protein
MTKKLITLMVAFETICIVILLLLLMTPVEVFTRHIEISIK